MTLLLCLIVVFNSAREIRGFRKDRQMIFFSKNTYVYANEATMDMGKAMREQYESGKIKIKVFHSIIWKNSNVTILVKYDSTLVDKRILVNNIFGDVSFDCDPARSKQIVDQCPSINSDLKQGLSNIVLAPWVPVVSAVMHCRNSCLTYVYGLASSSGNFDFDVNITLAGEPIIGRTLKRGLTYRIEITPTPSQMFAVTAPQRFTKIDEYFTPNVSFLLRIEFTSNMIRYDDAEYQVSDLVVTHAPLKSNQLRLSFGDMVALNFSVQVDDPKTVDVVLESGGGLHVASPHFQSSLVTKSLRRRVKFIMALDTSKSSHFGSIKVRDRQTGELAFHYIFQVFAAKMRKDMSELVYPFMLFSDVDGSDLDEESEEVDYFDDLPALTHRKVLATTTDQVVNNNKTKAESTRLGSSPVILFLLLLLLLLQAVPAVEIVFS